VSPHSFPLKLQHVWRWRIFGRGGGVSISFATLTCHMNRSAFMVRLRQENRLRGQAFPWIKTWNKRQSTYLNRSQPESIPSTGRRATHPQPLSSHFGSHFYSKPTGVKQSTAALASAQNQLLIELILSSWFSWFDSILSWFDRRFKQFVQTSIDSIPRWNDCLHRPSLLTILPHSFFLSVLNSFFCRKSMWNDSLCLLSITWMTMGQLLSLTTFKQLLQGSIPVFPFIDLIRGE